MKRDGEGPPPVGGSGPLRGGTESRLPAAGAVSSGSYYRAASAAGKYPAVQPGGLLPQQQPLMRRQQVRGAQQQQPLPPLGGDKNIITLYHSVITATIQRCSHLQNAKVLDAIERHWRMALQRRTAELRRSSSSCVSVAASSSFRGDTQQQNRPSTSNNGSSSRSSCCSRTSSAAAAESRALDQQQKTEKNGTAVEAGVSSGGTKTPPPPGAAAVEQKQGTGLNIKGEPGVEAVPESSPPKEKRVDIRIIQEQSPTEGPAETTEEAAGGGERATTTEENVPGNDLEAKEEDDDDDEFADADVDEAKPASEAAVSPPAFREAATSTEATGSIEKASQTARDATTARTARDRDETVQAQAFAGTTAARTAPEKPEANSGSLDIVPREGVEPLDFEQPESVHDVSDIDDQEPPTTDGIFALYEKVQRCGSSGRKATNWKVTLRHGIIRVRRQHVVTALLGIKQHH